MLLGLRGFGLRNYSFVGLNSALSHAAAVGQPAAQECYRRDLSWLGL